MVQFFSFVKRSKVKKEFVENQRQYPRKATHDLITIQYPYPVQGTYNLVNISEGGIQLTCPDRLLGPKDLFTCNINLAEEDIQIAVMAKIIWAKTFVQAAQNRFYHVGVSFLSIHEEACTVIRDFVHSPVSVP